MSRVALPVQLDAPTRNTLDKLIRSSSTPQSLALRSRIVLAAADGVSNQEIAAALKVPAITVGKWRRSFAIDGLEGLRDAPRSGRPPKHDANTRHQVQTRVCQQPEHQSRWSVRTLAAELGLPASTVHAMLVAAQLQPHRIRTFTFSPDPDFEAKLLDLVGLYLNPPENALVLCVDEKPGIQALDRTQPLLPLGARKTTIFVAKFSLETRRFINRYHERPLSPFCVGAGSDDPVLEADGAALWQAVVKILSERIDFNTEFTVCEKLSEGMPVAPKIQRTGTSIFRDINMAVGEQTVNRVNELPRSRADEVSTANCN